MARMAMRALALLALVSGAAAINSYIQPATTATQSEPELLRQVTAGTYRDTAYAGQLGFWRVTKETYARFYVACDGLTAGNTHSITYSLDGGASVTLASGLTATTATALYLEDLADGKHKLEFTCLDAGVAEATPLSVEWIVDTSTSNSIHSTEDDPSLTTDTTPTFRFTAKKGVTNIVNLIEWSYSLTKVGSSEAAYTTVAGCNAQQACGFTPTITTGDGDYHLKVKMVYTYTTTCVTSTPCADLDPVTTIKSVYFTLDSTAPGLAVTSSPSAKSAYVSGKTVTFEFGCTGEAEACTFECMFDGKNSADAGDSSAARGYFACTSPVKLTVANTTTHSFQARATDKAGNVGSLSQLYMFYSDGTAPVVTYTSVDTTATSTSTPSAQTVTQDTSFSAAEETRYNTVLQVPFDPTKASWEPSDHYGVVLGSGTVNGGTYQNVLTSTNAKEGVLQYQCTHPEFA